MAETGWSESFDKLEKALIASETVFTVNRAEQEIVMQRVFDAPRALVFKAFTDPTMIPRWWGPKYLSTTVEKMEVRPGGRWRFIQRGKAGEEFAFNGIYREVERPSHLVYTFEFEGTPGHVVIETVTFEEHNGKTTLTSTALFETVDDLDGMMKAGMESGALESMERFAEHLADQTPHRRPHRL